MSAIHQAQPSPHPLRRGETRELFSHSSMLFWFKLLYSSIRSNNALVHPVSCLMFFTPRKLERIYAMA